MDAAQLDQLVAKVLKEELREDGNTREQSLEQFRDWILKNPDIQNCITDESFLLPILRVRKHSVPLAEESLLKLLKFQHNFSSLHSNLDIEDPGINDIISSGYQFPSPFRSSNGQTVVLLIKKNLDTEKHAYDAATRALLLNLHTLARDEATQVLGIVTVCDYSQVSPALLTYAPMAAMRALTQNIEKAIPLRTKATHFINLPPAANWLFKIICSLLSEKMQSRMKFHSSLEELHQHVDPSVLPKEYGGTMPMAEMIGLWKKKLAVHRESILAMHNIKLVGDSLKDDLEPNDTGIPGLQGSFRQLGVD